MKNLISAIAVLVITLSSPFVQANGEMAEAKRAILTSGIESREPVDNLNDTTISIQNNKVYFFTEILNQANTAITHRWFKNGKLEAEVVLRIGSDRWRTYSSKNLVPDYHQGSWQVEVVSQSGKLLATHSFQYGN